MRILSVLALLPGCGESDSSAIDGGVAVVDGGVAVVDADVGDARPTFDAAQPRDLAYEVTVSDPDGRLPDAVDSLVACAEGGLAEWARYVGGAGTLTVEIRVTDTEAGRFAGASTSNIALGACENTAPPCTLVEEQAIHRLRTGLDNPAMVGAPDVRIDVAPPYWTDEVWVDPAPLVRSAAVPVDRLDCVSLFTHELGHALGMTGFRSLTTFQPTIEFQSLYDDHVRVGAETLTFEGPLTVGEFGAVPLTRTSTTQNVYHYGDASTPSAIDDLLMNGIVYEYGMRYFVRRLDARIVQDLGVPVLVLPTE